MAEVLESPIEEERWKAPAPPNEAEIRSQELVLDDEWEDWWRSLSEDDQREAIQYSSKFIEGIGLHGISPQEGPQTEAYFSKADVVGYGGAAGGGKSALIALLALGPHQRTVIYRADKTQMGGLIDDIVNFYGTRNGLNRQQGTFYFADKPGHMLEWGGLDKPNDEQKWRGRPHDLMCIDEATEIRRDKFEFLKTWNRTTNRGQRTRLLLTFNPPGGPEDKDGSIGRWVIDYFKPWLDERVPPEERAMPGEIRFFVKDKSGKEIQVPTGDMYELKIGDRTVMVKPESRTFIPAQVFDNEFLMHDAQYVSRLANLDEPFRTMMLLGEFRSGIVDADYQIVPTEWVDAAMDRWQEECTQPGFIYPQMESLGVDVARGGRHQTIYSPRHGWTWGKLVRLDGQETKTGRLSGQPALDMVRGAGDVAICIDGLGPGSSTFDFCNERHTNCISILSQGSAMDLQMFESHWKFKNIRAALWWLFRKILDPENDLKPRLPKDDKLRAELIAPRYKTAQRELRVELKEEVEKRMGWHPDDADAVVYSIRNLAVTLGADVLKSAPDANTIAKRMAEAKAKRDRRVRQYAQAAQGRGRRGRGRGWMGR